MPSAASAADSGKLDNLDSTDFQRTGATAGGDLAGTYPNPTIGSEAVDSAAVDDDSLTGTDLVESTLGKVGDSDTLDSLSSDAFGVRTSEAAELAESCDVALANNECAQVSVTVPAGRTYRASIWSSISFAGSMASAQNVTLCSAARQGAGIPACTGAGGVRQAMTIPTAGYVSGATMGETTLTGGSWTISTVLTPASATFTSDTNARVFTKVLLRDGAGPALP